MRAEYLAAMLAGSARSPDSVGYSTRPYDEKAAYLARVSPKAWAFAQLVFFHDITEANIQCVYRNVLLDVSHWWRPVGDRPTDPEALARWKARNTGLIDRLTLMGVAEAMRPGIGNPQKAEWRAAQVGVDGSNWRRNYRDRYARITMLMNEWESEFLGKVNVNQRDERMEAVE